MKLQGKKPTLKKTNNAKTKTKGTKQKQKQKTNNK